MQTLPSVSLCPKSTTVDFGTISVFITNLGKYNEGELVGEWLALPTSPEALANCLKHIGIDGVNYEEYFLTDYESIIDGINHFINEYSDLNELNYLASRLSELDDDDKSRYEAIVQLGDYIYSLKDLINLIGNLDCFDYHPDIHNEYDLGYYWIEESGCYDLSNLGHLASYFDYERFGRDIALEQGGSFVDIGYVYRNGEYFSEEYEGNFVPEEYCIL